MAHPMKRPWNTTLKTAWTGKRGRIITRSLSFVLYRRTLIQRRIGLRFTVNHDPPGAIPAASIGAA
eukprot:1799007-Pyramimonas_sp.AAC.1